MDATADLQERLERLFRERESSGGSVSGLTSITGGWENEVYALSLHHDADGARREDLILRLYPGIDAAEKSAWEREVMERLYDAGFPVPCIYGGSSTLDPLGKPYVLMEKIEGKSLGDAYADAPEAKKPGIAALFCRILARLHTLDWQTVIPELAQFGGEETPAFVQRHLEKWEGYAADSSLGDLEGFYRTLDWLKEKAPAVPARPLSLIHGDYHPQNLLLRNDGQAFVIDWGNASVSDFRYDLAWTLLLTSTYGNPETRPMILREYGRLRDEPLLGMDYFDMLAALRRLYGIYFSFRLGAAKMGMRPGAEAIMKENASHLETVYGIFREVSGLNLPEIEGMLESLAHH